MASYGFDGETTRVAKIAKAKGRKRTPKTKYKRRGPGKSPLVPVNRAEQIAGAQKKARRPDAPAKAGPHRGKTLPSSVKGNSASAPGIRKKALGLKSARTLAPGRAGKPAMPRAANPLPGSGAGGSAKAAAIASRGPKRQPPERPSKLGRGAMPQLPEAPRPGMADKLGAIKGRRRPPAKAGRRRGLPGL